MKRLDAFHTRVLPLAACLAGIALNTGCGLSDLRPKGIIYPENAEAKGRKWLAEAAAAQGGNALRSHTNISFWMSDEWPGWMMRMLAMPWPQNKQTMRADIQVGTDNSRLTFVGGPQDGEGWGIQQWVTYRFNSEGKLDFDPPDKADSKIKFWLPTNLYFPFLAWRLQEATWIRSIGSEKIGKRSYHKVFVSWDTDEPQKNIDQYIVYIDEETHLIQWVRYTVRDMMGPASGLLHYSEYESVGHLKFAKSMHVVNNFESDKIGIHGYTVQKIELDPELPDNWLIPRPELKAGK